MRSAVIGIGSNSLRLLVADTDNGRILPIRRERIGLRVFASLNTAHEIDSDMIHNACQAVMLLKQAALQEKAERIDLFATSAVRDALNQSALCDALINYTGLKLDIVSGNLEAKLSFLGSTSGRYAGMIDIGGGSTEIVIGDEYNILFSCSLQAGAVRLFQSRPIHTYADVFAAIGAVEKLFAPYMEKLSTIKHPPQWVGVGGTLTAAATAVQNIPWNTQDNIHGYIVQKASLFQLTENLADMELEVRKQQHSIPPDRADIIVHGFAVLLACMNMLAIDSIEISQYTNLDGYLRLLQRTN